MEYVHTFSYHVIYCVKWLEAHYTCIGVCMYVYIVDILSLRLPRNARNHIRFRENHDEA